jgi:phenylalanyl-tRNA synthetase beta chain
VWGMERVPVTLPGGRGRVGRLTGRQRWVRRIDATMRAAGLNETMTYSFVDPGDPGRVRMPCPRDEVLVELVNPMSEEQAVMRWSLLPGLLRSVSYNQRRGVPDVHLYEIGTVFSTSQGRKLPREHTVVGGVLAGSWSRPGWTGETAPLDFFDGKGVIEALVEERCPAASRCARRSSLAAARPQRRGALREQGRRLARRGPSVGRAQRSTPRLRWSPSNSTSRCCSATARGMRTYVEVPRQPAVTFDVALVVDESVSAERSSRPSARRGSAARQRAALRRLSRQGCGGGPQVARVGTLVPRPDRTLTDDEVRPVHEKLLRKVCSAVGAELRS